MARETEELDLADWCVLALVVERGSHGWALVRTMAAGGDVGRVWSCSRPRVYRAVGALEAAGLLISPGVEPGAQGPARRLLVATPAGRDAVEDWLAEPVHHVRDLRSSFLLKLLFLSRAERDPRPLLLAQRQALEPMVARFSARSATGFDRTLTRWRLESSRGALRFIRGMLAEADLSGG